MATSITALLVDDHLAVREGYRLLLAQFDIEVIGETDNGNSVLSDYGRLLPDVVILDLSIHGMNGLDCTARLMQAYPKAKIIIFSMHDNADFVMRAMQSGAMAYVLKSDPSAVLVAAIKQVFYQSKRYLSVGIANMIAMGNVMGGDKLSRLTPREHAVFLLLIEGKSRQQIATALSISMGTVSNNKTKIMQKLEAENVVDLIDLAVKSNALKYNQLEINT